MIEIFADNSYLVAILRKSDSLRARALELTAELLPHIRIVTSDLVLVELLNYFSEHGPFARQRAFEMLTKLRSNPGYDILSVTGVTFEKAARLYQRAEDKSWSFTDCSSFVIMRERGIRDALTYDHHFQQAGFRALMREDG
jgi:predicted nucleic acid-binding protein